MIERERVYIHESADVDDHARIGRGTRVWHNAQVMADVTVGENCTISKGAVLSEGTRLGDMVVVDNYANLFAAVVERGAFIGPLACVLHDPAPRAINARGERRRRAEAVGRAAIIREGASLGAGSIIAPGVVVGRYANVCAGSVVNRDVPDHTIVAGHPARQVGYVCRCGLRLDDELRCECGLRYELAGSAVEGPSLVMTQS
jgi:UDP-2-acetamido-3-amino-2,3-dideoxy-glucuronate N-acetyltransferase